MALCLRALAASAEDLGSGPAFILGVLQPPLTPVTGDPMLGSGFRGHLYAHGTHELMQVHTYTLKTNKNCMASHANPSTVENFMTFFKSL